MTNNEVIALVAADPFVRERHTRNGQEPSVQYLEGLASTEVQNEINALLHHDVIGRNLRGGIYALTLSTGTTIDQGIRFELPRYIGNVVDITIGSNYRPLNKYASVVEYNDWWYKSGGDNFDSEAEAWVPWGVSSNGNLMIVIGPTVTGDTTASINYERKVTQPVDMNILPDDLHDIVLLGVKNRLTGYALADSYRERLAMVLRRLKPMRGGATPMPHSKDMQDFCLGQAAEYAGPMTSDNPLFVSRSQ